jgi:hypothetical protein
MCRSRRLVFRRLPIAPFVIAFPVGLAACSMHPLPEDFSRASTYDVVEKIRCEAKAGLNRIPAGHPFLASSAIGYDFTFEITETNDLGDKTAANKGQLKFEKPGFRDGSNHIWDFTGSATRIRKNTRQFRIVETLADLKQAHCPDGNKSPDWIYPIAGSIGMDELVGTYVSLERLTDLAGGVLSNKIDTRPALFSDVLTFTTKLKGGAAPTLTLQTIRGKFRLSTAKIGTSASREDEHSVTVALAQDEKTRVEPPAARSGLRARAAARGDVDAPTGLSRQGARKVDAVAEEGIPATSRVLFELERRRVLAEDARLATRFLDAFRPQ